MWSWHKMIFYLDETNFRCFCETHSNERGGKSLGVHLTTSALLLLLLLCTSHNQCPDVVHWCIFIIIVIVHSSRSQCFWVNINKLAIFKNMLGYHQYYGVIYLVLILTWRFTRWFFISLLILSILLSYFYLFYLHIYLN